MTTHEAVTIARIMVDPKLKASDRVCQLLWEFEGIDWTDFLNRMDDYIDPATHEAVLYKIEQRREGRA